MKLAFKCLPYGALPYTDITIATRMMVKLFEKSPYLPFFPLASKKDTILHRTLDNIPNISLRDKKILGTLPFGDTSAGDDNIDSAYLKPTIDNLSKFSFDGFFMEKYFQFISRVKPPETIINLLGPFSISQMITTEVERNILADKAYRKLIVQAVTVKSLWIIQKIKELSPQTTPVIIFEEPKLNEFGVVKKNNEDISRELVVNLYSRIFKSIHDKNAAVGIQCLKKCDWQIPIDAGVDIISFDAYNNPNNLNIIADKIEIFLEQGGYINWAIVPVSSENIIKTETIDKSLDRYMRTSEELIRSGVNRELLYSRSKVSVQGDLSKLSIIFAEKALILSNQLAQRIPKK